MLYGVTLTDSKPLKASKLFESGEFQSYHLSAAVLDNCPDSKSKVKLVAKLENDKEISLALLSRDNEQAKLDLYLNVTQSIQILLKNAPKGTEVSLSGFFEPPSDDMDDDMFMGGQGMGEDDEDDYDDEEDEELVVKGKAIKKEDKQDSVAKLNSNLKAAQANTQKNAAGPADDDSEDYDEEEEPEDLGDLDEEDMESDSEETPAPKKKVVVADSDDESDIEDDVSSEPVPAKGKAKKEAAPASDSDDDDEDDKLAADDSEEDSDDEELALAEIMKKKFEASKKSKPSSEGKK
jgi:hypothetical protein